jgi:hypothetical protein
MPRSASSDGERVAGGDLTQSDVDGVDFPVLHVDERQLATPAAILLPSSTEVPKIEVIFAEHPSPRNLLGVKGVGESGCVPAAGAIVSAIESALAPFGVRIAEYPVTPARLFALLAPDRATAIRACPP